MTNILVHKLDYNILLHFHLFLYMLVLDLNTSNIDRNIYMSKNKPFSRSEIMHSSTKYKFKLA